MTSEEFLLGFKRFISVRGAPVEILSDNAAQFKLASKTLEKLWCKVIRYEDVQSYVSTSGIQWHFVVELASWMGGFYERLISLVKRSLRKSLGRRLLTLIQLQTLIKEIEAVINSRPLVYVENDVESIVSLTPCHFLTLNPRTGIPDPGLDNGDSDYVTEESSLQNRLKVWKKGQKILNDFWITCIWRNEYLIGLRERKQTFLKAGRVVSSILPQKDDIVLLKDNVPRDCWKIRRITEVKRCRDGEVRSAEVKLPSGKFLRRPLNLLYPIESSSSENTEILTEKVGQPLSPSCLKQCDRPVQRAAEIARAKLKQICE